MKSPRGDSRGELTLLLRFYMLIYDTDDCDPFFDAPSILIGHDVSNGTFYIFLLFLSRCHTLLLQSSELLYLAEEL